MKKHSKIRNKDKIISLILLFVFLSVGIFPTTLVTNTYADSDPGFRITAAEFSYNGTPLLEAPSIIGPFSNGDLINFTYHWEIDDATTITDGSNTLTLVLPDVFPIDAEASGLMNDDNNVSYGTYQVTNRNLIFTFTPGIIASNVTGGASFNLSFNFENISIDEPYSLLVPVTDTITKSYSIKITPDASTPSILKSGQAVNSALTRWTVDANMNLSDADDIIVIDSLDSRLLYVPSSLAIYPLATNSDGSYTVSGPAIDSSLYAVSYVPSNDVSPHALSFTIYPVAGDPIPNAYRIIYDATVDPDKIDFAQTSFTYNNTANLNGTSSSASTTITGGNILTKSELGDNASKFNPSQLNWKITVNEAGYPLKAVRVEDILPPNLLFDKDTDVVILDENNVDVTIAYTVNYDGGTRTLSVDFGDLSVKREIQINTNIDPEYIKGLTSGNTNKYFDLSFANSAKLYQTQNGTESETNKNSTLSTKVGKLIYKTGNASVSYDNAKYINWNLYVNLANIDTGATTITDTLDARQTLPIDLNDLHVYPVTIDDNGTLTEGAEIVAGFTKSFDAGNPTRAYEIVFDAPITTPYVIKYTATINQADFDKTSFSNTGMIDIGAGVSYTGSVNQTIKNTFTKSNTDIDNDGKAFDYNTKTFDWKITVSPTKEAIQDLEIIDTFSAGLKMTDSEFDALVIKRGATPLTKDVDYTITKTITGGVIKGFTIKFHDGAVNHIVNQAVYTVLYKTSIDEATLSTNGNLNYANSAEFNWDVNSTLPVVTTVPTINPLHKYNGNKSGSLDLATKQITWNINLNYLSKDLNGLKVTDQINIDADGSGEKLVPSSIKIYKDTVDSSGNLKSLGITELSPSDLITEGIIITEDLNANSFTIDFTGNVSEPYRIVYKTDMVGISSTNYTNTAMTNKGENYTANVTHTTGLTFVDKTGARSGEFVNWTLTINQGKSTISNLIISDQLNEGLELVENSFTLTQNGNPLTFADYFNVEVAPRNLSSDPQRFEISAISPIVDTMVIGYQTSIVTDNIVSTSFSNTATVNGQYIVQGTRTKTVTITHNIMESNGWAVGQLGSFTLKKVDESGVALPGAKFEFYKGATLIGTLTTDSNGEIHVEKLKYATYTLKEVEAPTGYQIVSSSDDVVINSTTDKDLTITNDALRTIQIKKLQKNSTTNVLAGAVFEIKKSGVLVQTITTNQLGIAELQVPYGTYDISEKTAPNGYRKSNEIKTLVISDGDLNEDLTLRTTYALVFENEVLPNYEPPTAEPTTEATTEPTSESTTEVTIEITTEPTTEKVIEKTPENIPKEGEIIVPEGSKPTVSNPPSNGKVEIDKNGKWIYTPNPGYIGKDQFEVILVDPEGNEEEFIIDIEIEEVPLGPALPQTGQSSLDWLYWLGIAIVGLGVWLRKGKFA
ncbi:collagen binding domain-containing protein [Fusibacter bizertensis]|uniref:Collagen binding domain-containing protein n=1 Tax=Fusibacter bizertensis TaxID=1488331 RepID=A0ABT6N8N2_9FIRM|nr:collagen binding domain-containing protein [Fusibacter bizertensis]MDH8676764.1 collagen binding domain-containing protein [Fusibacter bizertensis]